MFSLDPRKLSQKAQERRVRVYILSRGEVALIPGMNNKRLFVFNSYYILSKLLLNLS